MLLTTLLDSLENKAYIDEGYLWEEAGANPYIKAEATVSAGYADISSIAHSIGFAQFVKYSFNQLRNELMGFNASWATLSDADKKLLIENYVYPSATPTAELDALYTQTERDAFRDEVIQKLNSDTKSLFSVWRDVADGKHYKVTVDAGVTTKYEITT